MPVLTNDGAKLLLDEVRTKLNDPLVKEAQRRDLVVKLHALAEHQYEPAVELFVWGLSDPDSSWRYQHLICLGFHYPVTVLEPQLSKLQSLLLYDPDEDVRRASAGIIGRIGAWPERTLLSALVNDADEMVREAAFEALLMQSGIPIAELRPLRYELRQRGVDVTLEALKEIAQRSGLSIDQSSSQE